MTPMRAILIVGLLTTCLLLVWFMVAALPNPKPDVAETASAEPSVIPDEEMIATTTAPIISPHTPDLAYTEPEPEAAPKVIATPESAVVPRLVPSPSLRTAAELQWGTYVGYTPADLQAFEDLVGAEVDIRAIFVNWDSPFPTSVANHLASEGKTLLLFWEHHGVTLDRIIAGDEDEYIKQFAAAAKASPATIMLAPLHEMNGNWDPWDGTVGNNTPEKVILAWRRMFDIFKGAPNISFAWTVNNVSVPDTPENQLENYYPGDEYVDIVGVDGFNFGRPWQNPRQVFGDVLERLNVYDKPIYILSTATAEGDRKADWIYDFEKELSDHPEVKGWVWFHIDKERDWRVDSDPAALKAFQAIIPE